MLQDYLDRVETLCKSQESRREIIKREEGENKETTNYQKRKEMKRPKVPLVGRRDKRVMLLGPLQ